jgi:quercetin dioxygenase-like cupin family protein
MIKPDFKKESEMESIKQIGERIKGMRGILEISAQEMAELTEMSEAEYLSHEKGERDFTFSFLNRCADRFGLDIAELITGENAHLKEYTVVRKGGGLSVERRKGFEYKHLAGRFKDRNCQPFHVTVPFVEELQDKPIKMNTHEGQEMDYVLEGTLKIMVNGKTEILNAGDCIYYDSSLPHGMIAVNGKECKFLAILINS